jgi:hypothetical protein
MRAMNQKLKQGISRKRDENNGKEASSFNRTRGIKMKRRTSFRERDVIKKIEKEITKNAGVMKMHDVAHFENHKWENILKTSAAVLKKSTN